MSHGPCPECKFAVELSADVCPNCGNDYFEIKTERVVEDLCPDCSGRGEVKPKDRLAGDWEECGCCHGRGIIRRAIMIDARVRDRVEAVLEREIAVAHSNIQRVLIIQADHLKLKEAKQRSSRMARQRAAAGLCITCGKRLGLLDRYLNRRLCKRHRALQAHR